jgi:hypothetical protein
VEEEVLHLHPYEDPTEVVIHLHPLHLLYLLHYRSHLAVQVIQMVQIHQVLVRRRRRVIPQIWNAGSVVFPGN